MAHSKYLIVSPSGITVQGDTLFGAVFSTTIASVNPARRCVQINGVDDGITIGADYDHDQADHELAIRALVLLRRRGYALYRLQDPT
jgi:hypothetical protein